MVYSDSVLQLIFTCFNTQFTSITEQVPVDGFSRVLALKRRETLKHSIFHWKILALYSSLLNRSFHVKTATIKQATWSGRQVSKFNTSLVYKVTSRTAKTTNRNSDQPANQSDSQPTSQTNKKQTQWQLKTPATFPLFWCSGNAPETILVLLVLLLLSDSTCHMTVKLRAVRVTATDKIK